MQTAVNRNGCILSSPGAASCPAEKLGPNFIADAAVPVGDPCFLEVAAVVNSRDLLHKTLFFSDGNVFQMASHNICTGIRREDSWQTKQNEQGQRNPEKPADLFLGP